MDRRMRNALPLLILVCSCGALVALSGCGNNNLSTASIQSEPESFILGTWDGRLVFDEKSKVDVGDSPNMAESRKVALSSEFRFEYRENGVIRMSVRYHVPGEGFLSNEVEGSWKIVRETEKEIRLVVEYEGSPEESLRFVIIDDNTLENSDPEDFKGFRLKMSRVGE
jgi:hypothetical protein